MSQNNFRVYKGPYNDFEKLKKGFHNIENLDFDSIEIISRKTKKKVSINNLNSLPKLLKKKIK